MNKDNYVARQDRRAAGLCWDCGDPPEPSKSRCRRCLDRNIKARTTKVREDRHAAGKCWDCENSVVEGRTRCRSCLDIYNQRVTQGARLLKVEVMNAYGGRCACCGEEHMAMLAIDHIAQDGADQRRKGERTGPDLWRKVKNLGYPSEYRVLCLNCNWAVYHAEDGRCPHGTGCFATVL